jgi:penicillin amidase
VVAQALDKTAAKLETLFESDTPDDWRWGRIHTVSLESLFASAGVTKFNHGPFASDGGVFTVDVAEPVGSDEDYSHSAGPSLRLAVEATESGMQGTFQLPGGQDHHRESKWYASLLDEWLADDPSDLLFEDAEVEDNAEKSLVIEPK